MNDAWQCFTCSELFRLGVYPTLCKPAGEEVVTIDTQVVIHYQCDACFRYASRECISHLPFDEQVSFRQMKENETM